MSFQLDDTIAAVASAPGSAARGIVRISGPETLSVLKESLRTNEEHLSTKLPRQFASEWPLADGKTSLPVDVLLWPNQRSYTGQILCEVHTVGSPPLLERILIDLYQRNVRPARAGEFTLRAFLAGRLDLMQAEAVLGVIDANDHEELQTALKQLGGGLSGVLGELRADLLDLLSELEAGLDFVEEDIEFVERGDLIRRLTTAGERIAALARQAEMRMESTGRVRVVLAGLPNAGKSCLFNALAEQDAAIVSPIKGTTRDVLHTTAEWGGITWELRDTAGYETSEDAIMQIAETSRDSQTRDGDLILFCEPCDLSSDEVTVSRQLYETLIQVGVPVLVVRTKSDMADPQHPKIDAESVSVCAMDGGGLDDLKVKMVEIVGTSAETSRELIGSTASRCRESLFFAGQSIEEALHAAEESLGEELIAVEIHQALEHLGRILGTVYTDDILDRIFSKFCIGK